MLLFIGHYYINKMLLFEYLEIKVQKSHSIKNISEH
jgi:hypothetical protein